MRSLRFGMQPFDCEVDHVRPSRVVPTWDYVAVHAHGTIRFFDEPERLLDVVTRLTARHEHARAALVRERGA